MASAKKTIFINQFTEGLQTHRPAHDIPDGASPFMKNVDLGRSFDGVLAKRRGTDTRHAELDVANLPRVTGLWEFVRFDGGDVTGESGTAPVPDVQTKYLYASAYEDVYELSGDNWISRYHNASIQGTEVNFTTFNNLIFVVNENSATKVGQGGAALTTALGTPPANGKYLASWMGRVWIANTSAGRSRVHWSAANDGQDWVAVLDAGFVDVSPDDGEEITALVPCGDYMYIFKRHSVHVISGYKPDNFVLHRIPNIDGCIANRTAVSNGAFIMYLSDTAVRTISGGGASIGELSPLIRYDIENLSVTTKMRASGGLNQNKQYWLCYDSDGDLVNDSAYVLNLLPQIQAWTHYTNIKSSVFLVMNNMEFISGGDDKVVIRTHEVGDSDEGEIIPFEWHSKEHEFTSVYDYKKLHDFGIDTKVLAGKNITVDTYVDGINANDTITFLLTQTLGVAQDTMVKLTKMKQSEQGRSIKFVIKNAEANAPIEIYSYSAQCEVIERQMSD